MSYSQSGRGTVRTPSPNGSTSGFMQFLYGIWMILVTSIAIAGLILGAMSLSRSNGDFIKHINSNPGPDLSLNAGDNIVINTISKNVIEISSFPVTAVEVCGVYAFFGIGVNASNTLTINYPTPFVNAPLGFICDFLEVDSGGNVTLTEHGFYFVNLDLRSQRGGTNTGSTTWQFALWQFPFPTGLYGLSSGQAWVTIPEPAGGAEFDQAGSGISSSFFYNGTLPFIMPFQLIGALTGVNNDYGSILVILTVGQYQNFTLLPM